MESGNCCVRCGHRALPADEAIGGTVSLEHDIHTLRIQGLSFSQIGARVGLTKDQVQKRYQKYLLASPLPHTPSPEGDRFY
jgi:hypothetical protein